MYLLVSKLHKGRYIPFSVVERKCSEQVLMHVVQEACINGGSTKKLERLAKSLDIENLSDSRVSEVNKGLNEQAEAFRTQLLEKEYPALWLDVLYEKIRCSEGYTRYKYNI